MKKLLLGLLCLVVFVCLAQDFGLNNPAFVGTLITPPAGGGATYLINQNFEGTGYDNGESWTETGTFDEDSTSPAIRESQSGKGTPSGSDISTKSSSFGNQDDVWIFTRFQFDADPTQSHNFIYYYSNTTFAGYITANGNNSLTARHNTTSSTGASNFLTNAVPYSIWIHYIKGSGADGTLEVYCASNSLTRPASTYISITTGNGTIPVNAIELKADNNSGEDLATSFDQVLVDDVSIGDVAP